MTRYKYIPDMKTSVEYGSGFSLISTEEHEIAHFNSFQAAKSFLKEEIFKQVFSEHEADARKFASNFSEETGHN